MPKSFAPQVIADSSGKFVGNALRFATREEAQANANNLAQRWFLVTATRVIESEDPVNYRWLDAGNVLVPVPALLGHEDMIMTCEDKQIFRMHGLTPDGGLDTPVKRYQQADQRDADYMRATVNQSKAQRIVGRWEVAVRTHERNRGYFENIHNGNGGMLIFEGRRLTDFDGVYELPIAVMTALADLGYVLDWTMLDLPAPAMV